MRLSSLTVVCEPPQYGTTTDDTTQSGFIVCESNVLVKLTYPKSLTLIKHQQEHRRSVDEEQFRGWQ